VRSTAVRSIPEIKPGYLETNGTFPVAIILQPARTVNLHRTIHALSDRNGKRRVLIQIKQSSRFLVHARRDAAALRRFVYAIAGRRH